MDIIFVFGFFLMLLLTGVSLIGVIAAPGRGLIVMFVGGMVMLIVKVLPWLLLAVAAVWLYRRFSLTKTLASASCTGAGSAGWSGMAGDKCVRDHTVKNWCSEY